MQILFFLLGVHLAVELIAAAYQFVDLRYRIAGHLPRILLRLAWWVGVLVLLEYLLPADYRGALHAGVIAFALFHVGIFWFGQLLRALLRMQPTSAAAPSEQKLK